MVQSRAFHCATLPVERIEGPSGVKEPRATNQFQMHAACKILLPHGECWVTCMSVTDGYLYLGDKNLTGKASVPRNH